MGNSLNRDWTGNSRSAFACVAPSNHTDGVRAEHDYYATEPRAVELLMGLEKFSHMIWEPACGEGHISKVLKSHGYDVRESDIVDRMGNEVLDFLTVPSGGGEDLFQQEKPYTWEGDIVSNPPYVYAAEFVTKALEIIPVGHKVAMFLKLTFLESATRRELFKKYPPIRVWVASKRLRCLPNGEDKGGALIAYCWYIWEKGFHGDPKIKWFN